MTTTPDYDALVDEQGDPRPVVAEIASLAGQPAPVIEQSRRRRRSADDPVLEAPEDAEPQAEQDE